MQNANNRKSFTLTGNDSLDALSYTEKPQYIKFFKKGLNYSFPSEKRQYQGRILPAHDTTINSADPNFATSVAPYRVCPVAQVRDNSDLDTTRGVPRPTNWFVGMAGYRMFGNLKADILSPMTKRAYPATTATSREDLADPIADIHKLARNHPQYKRLTEDGGNLKAPTIPKSRTFAIMNALARNDAAKPLENQLLILPKTGLDSMLDKLAWPTIYGQTPRDMAWPEFMFGDITHPTTGLWFISCLQPAGSFMTNTVCFSSQPNSLMGSSVFPVEQKALAQRYALDHNMFEWLSYQQIVDLLVEDGTIPHELITEACQHLANIPAASKKGSSYAFSNNVTNVSQAAPTPTAPVNLGSFALPPTSVVAQTAPAIPQAPVAPVAPAAPSAPKVEVKYWFAVVNGDKNPELVTEVEAKVRLNHFGEKSRFMAESGGQWQTPQQMGWVKPPVAPSAPPSAPVVEITESEVKVPLGNEYVSSGGSLSDAEVAEMKSLREKMHLNSAPPEMHEITRLMNLESRARQNSQAV